jgi:3-oxoacyl-[acyl-carrier protein] reductase
LLVKADVAQGEQALMLARKVEERFKRADLLVANAGVWRGAEVENISEELWHQVVDINLKGTWSVCRAFVPLMKKQGRGSIVIVSSTAGQRGEAGYSNYAASKGGQISFAKALATELAPAIRVNCVAPGWVDTELNAPVFHDETYKQQVAAAIPLGRIATADDIAGPIAFLASDWSRHITGEVLNINGGAVLCG